MRVARARRRLRSAPCRPGRRAGRSARRRAPSSSVALPLPGRSPATCRRRRCRRSPPAAAASSDPSPVASPMTPRIRGSLRSWRVSIPNTGGHGGSAPSLRRHTTSPRAWTNGSPDGLKYVTTMASPAAVSVIHRSLSSVPGGINASGRHVAAGDVLVEGGGDPCRELGVGGRGRRLTVAPATGPCVACRHAAVRRNHETRATTGEDVASRDGTGALQSPAEPRVGCARMSEPSPVAQARRRTPR